MKARHGGRSATRRALPPSGSRGFPALLAAFLAAPIVAACGPAPAQEHPPVLAFPEKGVDDPEAYEGYATRFYRDASGNAVQVYLNRTDGRVVHVWADAANESAAFGVRDAEGEAAPLGWASDGARIGAEGETRSLSHRLAVDAGSIEIGAFLLGTMRQERDFQYAGRQRRPLTEPAFVLPELTALIEALERLPEEERRAHLALLNAADAGGLGARLEPMLELTEADGAWRLAVEHTSLDGRNRLALALAGDAERTEARLLGNRVAVRALDGGPIELDVTVITDAAPLTPLGRERLFNDAYEGYLAEREATADSLHAVLSDEEAASDPRLLAFRRLERQILALELLSSEEKLMASLPNYATYFGRDQMMSALMLEPISSVDLQELVIASVLRKVDATGDVSHEEALGGQAIREAAAEYARLVGEWETLRADDAAAAAGRLAAARALLGDLQRVRENYHMVDDDFQLAVLVDRYLARPDVPDERARAFLSGGDGTLRRADALLRNLALVARLARPYAERPAPENLVAFYREDDEGPLPGSWRDSRAGYGNGRWGMDVNVVWVPGALEALPRIVEALDRLGFDRGAAAEDAPRSAPGGASGAAVEGASDASALEAWLADRAALDAAVATWRGARRHFEVRLEPAAIRRGVETLLAGLPAAEAAFWRARLEGTGAADRSLPFLALALAADGTPIRAPNTDPATELFLRSFTGEILAGDADPAAALTLVDAMARPYPVGLSVDGLGPLVVNAAYASERVRRRFREDPYHSPRVVWGREVNLLLLGLAGRIAAAYDEDGRPRSDDPSFRAYVAALRALLERTETAVEASGLAHNELWSYRIEDGELRPVRYGQSSDIQLWNVTDLAVGYALDRLPDPERQE